MAGNITVGSVQFNEFDGEHDIGEYKFVELDTPVYTWKVGGSKIKPDDKDLHLYMGSYFYAPDDKKCVEIMTITPNGSSDGLTPKIKFNGLAEFAELNIESSALSGEMIINGTVTSEKLVPNSLLQASITGTAKRAEEDANGNKINTTYVNKDYFTSVVNTKLDKDGTASQALRAHGDKDGRDITEHYCRLTELDSLVRESASVKSILERLTALETTDTNSVSLMGVHTASNVDGDSHYISLQPRINPQYVVTLSEGEYTIIAKEFDGIPDMTYTVNIIIKQTSGNGPVAWDGNIRWANGVVPTIPTEADGMVTVSLTSYDSGITWLGKQGEVY